ncbi:MAG: hypothetical protein IH600_11505 [Bacteroidetes bacterium]|nr:hypothetical protein [Bacteroidota bacterium]
MKITFFLIALALSTSPLFAQDKPESKTTDAGKQAQIQQQKDRPTFVDENGDGLDDRINKDEQIGGSTNGQGRQLRQHRRDHFIDQDGDGINDDRCSGTGLRQGRRRGAAKGGGE